MKCCLCEQIFNGDRTPYFNKNPPICWLCGQSFIENLFANKEFNEWLDSFLQSRIQKYIPTYNEYYTQHNKSKCPECNGVGFVDGKVCHKCNWIGTIEE
jgi:hypothetical protein